MAQWGGTTNTIIRPYRHPSGSFPIRYYEESTCAATAVIKRGDIVCFNTVVTTALRILRAPSSGGDGTNLLQVGIGSLVGVAADNSTSDGSTTGLAGGGLNPGQGRKIGVWLADKDSEFIGFPSTAGAGPVVVTSTVVGVSCPVIYNRPLNRFFLDSTNVSTAALFAVKITDVPSESLGDTNGPVIFKFLSSNVASVV